jgi:hypothetical protein
MPAFSTKIRDRDAEQTEQPMHWPAQRPLRLLGEFFSTAESIAMNDPPPDH